MTLPQKTQGENGFGVLKYDMNDLTPLMIKQAEEELSETSENKTRALKELRDLIINEELTVPLDDDYLLQYLRCRKFDAERAFGVLKNFWNIARKYRHVYENIRMQRIEENLLINYIGILPYRDRFGSTVIIAKLGQWNTEKFSFEDIMQVVSVLLNVSITYPATQVCGYRFIFDLNGLSWSHVKFFLKHVKMTIDSILNCFPGRYNGFHIVFEKKLFYHLFTVLHPLLPLKVKKRIFVHGSDFERLTEFIHRSMLPREYGGEAENLNNAYLWQKTMKNETKRYLDFILYGYKN